MMYTIVYEEIGKNDDGKSTPVVEGSLDIYHANNEAEAISEAIIPLRERARLNGTEITIRRIETKQRISIPVK